MSSHFLKRDQRFKIGLDFQIIGGVILIGGVTTVGGVTAGRGFTRMRGGVTHGGIW